MKNTHTNPETTMTQIKNFVADATYITLMGAYYLLMVAALALTGLGFIGVVFGMCK